MCSSFPTIPYFHILRKQIIIEDGARTGGRESGRIRRKRMED